MQFDTLGCTFWQELHVEEKSYFKDEKQNTAWQSANPLLGNVQFPSLEKLNKLRQFTNEFS